MKRTLKQLTSFHKDKKHSFKSLDASLKKFEGQQVGVFVQAGGGIAIAAADKSFVRLVFVPIDGEGNPVQGAESVSLALPCPPYCTKDIVVVTQN